mgnify:FL=1
MKILFASVIALGLIFLAAEAQTLSQFQYPIAELGSCGSEAACVAYCDDALHAPECLAFAKEHKLIPPEEIEAGEKLLALKGGPGGCNSRRSCESYCNDVGHIDECVAFAEANGFLKGRDM